MRTLAYAALLHARARGGAGRLALVLVASSVLAPGVARADLARLVREGADQLTCVAVQPCDNPGGSCAGAGGTELMGDTCETLPDGTLGCANTGSEFLNEIFCCTTADDCGSMGGHSGTCVMSANIDGWGLCNYTLIDYCDAVDQVNESDILKCLSEDLSGNVLTDFYEGDCDADGTLNGDEEPGCMCDRENACLLPADAGVGNRGPSFTGEGGCAMAPATSSALPTVVWLAPLALAFVRRRRGRTKPRTRRPAAS